MKRLMSFLMVSLLGIVVCGCLHAESRVRVYADVDRPVVLAGTGGRVVVKVGLSGIEGDCYPRRMPVNVAIVLDKSGSMRSYDKMANARRGAIEIVERLTKDDILSLIVYDTSPRVIIPAQRVRDRDALIETIMSIDAGGSTALYGGVTYGAAEVRKNLSWKYLNRVILLSDGLANVGPQSTEDLAQLGLWLGKEGMAVTTIGVGLDYNEDLMTALAAESGGNSYFASTSGELPRIFAEEIGEAMTIVARDVRVRIECPSGIRPMSIIGRKGHVSGQSMTAEIGQVYGTNDKYALFEIEVPEESDGREIEVAQVTVEYADPITNDARNARQRVTVAYDADHKVVEERENKQVIKEAAITRVSDAKMEAVSLADRGDYKGAADVVKKGAAYIRSALEKCEDDLDLVVEAVVCDSLSQQVTDNMGFTNGERKRLVNEAYTQTTQQGYVSDGKKQK